MTARTTKSQLIPVSSTTSTPQTKSPTKVSGSGNDATAKFNFLAWAIRKHEGHTLGAVDLQVLVQLVVRNNPNEKLKMHVGTLEDRVGASESSVRQAVSRLEKAGFITVVKTTGRANKFTVNYHLAPAGWVASETDRYNAARDDQWGASNFAGAPVSTSGGAEIPEGTPPESSSPPLQNPGPISISSQDYKSISSSICPSGRLQKSTFVEEKNNGRGPTLAEVTDQGVPRRRAAAPPAQARLGVGAGAGGADADEDFDTFVSIWPKRDKNPNMLRKTWDKYVRGYAVDPDLVLDAAEAVAEHYRANPDARLPMAGKWLKDKSWKNTVTTPTKGDLGLTGDGRRLVDTTATANRPWNGSGILPAVQDRGPADADDDLAYPSQGGEEECEDIWSD